MKQNEITADWNTLMEQSSKQSHLYLIDALNYIDRELGENYAKEHPALVAAFLQSSSIAMQGVTIGVSIQSLKEDFKELTKTIGDLKIMLETD